MHPGNIFVGPNDQYIAVDFGIVGSIKADQHYVAENLLAFFGGITAVALKCMWNQVGCQHPHRGVRVGHPHRLRADFREAAEGNFLRPLIAALVPGGSTVRHGSPAATGAFTKDLAQHRRPGPRPLPDLDLWKTAKPFLENWFRHHQPAGGLSKTARTPAGMGGAIAGNAWAASRRAA